MTVTDVLVVGAGIVGACIADALSARGAAVDVVEAAPAPATGSTGRSAAGVRGQWSDETNALVSWHSIQQYAKVADEVGYRPVGYLLLVPEADWERHLEGVALQERLGIPVETLTCREAQRHIRFEEYGLAGCTFGSSDGFIDPHLVTTRALGLARGRGARLHLASPVTGIEQVGTRWRVVAGERVFETATVVNAAGGWSGEVAALAGLDVPVQHVRRMIFGTASDESLSGVPMVIDASSGFYMRSEGDRLLLGRSDPDEVAGYRTDVCWDWLEPTLTAGIARFPWLADVPLDDRVAWAGTYDTSPDHQAILGRMPGADGWVNACGFSGHGVMQAAAVGTLIAEEVLDGRAHSIDIDALRLDRFAEGTAPISLVF